MVNIYFKIFRWSAIAAKLSGRTDNEIKNVWHTHLKKRLKQYQTKPDNTKKNSNSKTKIKSEPSTTSHSKSDEVPSSSSSSSEVVSSIIDGSDHREDYNMDSWEYLVEIDESFWSDALSSDESQVPSLSTDNIMEPNYTFGENLDDSMEFWYDLFIKADGSEQGFLTQF